MWNESERDGKFILEWITKGSYKCVDLDGRPLGEGIFLKSHGSFDSLEAREQYKQNAVCAPRPQMSGK